MIVHKIINNIAIACLPSFDPKTLGNEAHLMCFDEIKADCLIIISDAAVPQPFCHFAGAAGLLFTLSTSWT